MPNKKNAGFTLIEVIIYVALFSLLMGMAFIVGYQLIDSSNQLGKKTTIQDEGNFVLRKIDWALTGITSPTPFGGTPSTLTVIKYNGNQIDFQLSGTKIELKESAYGNTFRPITTDNVTVSSLKFSYLTPTGTSPAGITAMANINGVDFTISKYIRK